jgi:hypothetical protein
MPEGGADQLIQTIQSSLDQLNQLVSSTQAATDEDRAQLQSIAQSFNSFVSGNLGQAPGQNMPKEGPPQPGTTSMEAGGNPNVRQAI